MSTFRHRWLATLEETLEPTLPHGAPEIACPHCRAALRDEGGLVCAQHGPQGRCGADGVLEFADDSRYWGEIEREPMRQIVAAARQLGWREAVQRHLAPAAPDLVPYVQHPSRADWRVLLPLERQRTVSLDVGAGWGAISFGLAPHVLRHYAVERVAERVAFIGIRSRQDGVQNVVPVRADLHAIPLAPHSIDVIAVNGVLEWAGLVDPLSAPGRAPRPPRELQEQFLRQLHGLLRPGGWLYVGIENRYGRMFWRGAPDHQGLRFTSLMPRRLASVYTGLRAQRAPRIYSAPRDYRTWTYSLSGYRDLFATCGFEALQSYAVVPGYNAPMQLIPLDSKGPLLWLAGRSRSPRRLLGRLRRVARLATCAAGLEKHVSSHYVFVARAPGAA